MSVMTGPAVMDPVKLAMSVHADPVHFWTLAVPPLAPVPT